MILVAARSKTWVCGRSVIGIGGLNPARDVDFSLLSMCLLSDRGLCVGLITRTEESY